MTIRTRTIEYLLEQKSPVRRLAGVVFCRFLQKNRLSGLKVKPFILFPHHRIPYLCSFLPHRGTVSLLAPVPPWVQYLCLLPSRRGTVSLFAPVPPWVQYLCWRMPYRGIQYSRSYPPYQRSTTFLPAHAPPRYSISVRSAEGEFLL